MKRDDPERALGRLGEQLPGPLQLGGANTAGLVAPGSDRVEPDCEDVVAAVHGLGGLPVPLELPKRVREPGGEGVRDVVVARNHEQRAGESLQEGRCALVLLGRSAVRQIAARDDQTGVDALDQGVERTLDFRRLDGADMQVGKVKEPRWHRRSRLVH